MEDKMLLEEVTMFFFNTVPFVSENSHNTGSTLFFGEKTI